MTYVRNDYPYLVPMGLCNNLFREHLVPMKYFKKFVATDILRQIIEQFYNRTACGTHSPQVPNVYIADYGRQDYNFKTICN